MDHGFEALRMLGHEKEAYKGELFPKLVGTSAKLRIENEATDFSWSVRVEAELEGAVDEASVDRLRELRFLSNRQIEVGLLP